MRKTEPSNPPQSQHKEGVPKALKPFLWIANGFEWIQIIAWLLFLIIFPPLALYNGMWFAALVLSVLSLWGAWYSLSGDGRWPRFRYLLSRFLYIEHAAILSLSLWSLLYPPRGDWERVAFPPFQTTSVKVFAPRPDMLLVWTDGGKHDGSVFSMDPVTQRWSAFSENTPVMGGWVVQYDAFRDWLWFGLHDEDRINFYDFKNSRWRGLPCAEGQVRSLAVWRDRLFTIVGRHLYTTDDKMERGWKAFACGGYCASIVSNKDLQRPYLFLTGRRWYESHNGGFRWKDITPPPHLVTGRFKAHLGAQGRRYAFQGGLLNGTLVTAAPGQSFEKRPLPASDIRVLITDPQDDRQVWIGTWGQGVFYSPDTGKTWKDLKLQGVEVRYLVRFQDALYAGSSNLVFNKGLYRQKITPKTRPRQPSTRSARPSRPAL